MKSIVKSLNEALKNNVRESVSRGYLYNNVDLDDPMSVVSVVDNFIAKARRKLTLGTVRNRIVPNIQAGPSDRSTKAEIIYDIINATYEWLSSITSMISDRRNSDIDQDLYDQITGLTDTNEEASDFIFDQLMEDSKAVKRSGIDSEELSEMIYGVLAHWDDVSAEVVGTDWA